MSATQHAFAFNGARLPRGDRTSALRRAGGQAHARRTLPIHPPSRGTYDSSMLALSTPASGCWRLTTSSGVRSSAFDPSSKVYGRSCCVALQDDLWEENPEFRSVFRRRTPSRSRFRTTRSAPSSTRRRHRGHRREAWRVDLGETRIIVPGTDDTFHSIRLGRRGRPVHRRLARSASAQTENGPSAQELRF